MKRVCLLIALLAVVLTASGQSADDQYVRIFNLIQEADSLANASQTPTALAKFQEAQIALLRFQKGYPDWNPSIVKFRLSYIGSRIAELGPKVPAAGAAPSATGVKPPAGQTQAPQPGLSPETQMRNQIATLNEQVRQLQGDKSLLESKLKEALSVQPAAVDAREVARAGEQAKTLQKENELLKVRLAQEQARAVGTGDAKALEQTRKELAEANQQLAAQTEKTKSLETERKTLQSKLDSLIQSSWNASNIDATKKGLAEANRQLAANKELIARLTAEKQALQDQLKAYDTKAAAALAAENQTLKKQLADLKRRRGAKGGDFATQLAEAQAQIAALQSDKEILRLEKIALQNRFKDLQSPATQVAAASAAPAAVVPSPVVSNPDQSRRIQDLERERDLLQQKLDAANKLAFADKSKPTSGRLEELENQVLSLRLRLEVIEARRVPFTAEELVLLKQPQPKLAESAPAKRSVTELPPGSNLLVSDARRYFAARQFDKAEQNYLQILSKNETNALTLANLASVQLQMNHLAEAEKNITKAVSIAPDDPFSLMVLGQVRVRQKQYDQAMEALSHAANVDPQNPEIQNLLGLVLSEKGLRVPAETALRKAIQLRPGYGDAHNNLAVIYLTQTPPSIELARWHYQKGLAAGTRNPELEKMIEEREKTVRAK
jgi:hypothetical protein